MCLFLLKNVTLRTLVVVPWTLVVFVAFLPIIVRINHKQYQQHEPHLAIDEITVIFEAFFG